jgi:hypothetical protein
MPEKQDERRRYFRVTDHVGLSVKVLSASERELSIAGEVRSPDNMLSKIDIGIRKLTASIRKRDEELAMALSLLNKKIDMLLVSGSNEGQENSSSQFKNELVNISACGIAFPWSKDIALAQSLELGIKLYPSEEIIFVMASVVGCERRDAFASDLSEDEVEEFTRVPFWIRADFEDLRGSGQELLVQHVIQRQAQELQRKRAEKA